jgi:hypothetical protein
LGGFGHVRGKHRRNHGHEQFFHTQTQLFVQDGILDHRYALAANLATCSSKNRRRCIVAAVILTAPPYSVTHAEEIEILSAAQPQASDLGEINAFVPCSALRRAPPSSMFEALR